MFVAHRFALDGAPKLFDLRAHVLPEGEARKLEAGGAERGHRRTKVETAERKLLAAMRAPRPQRGFLGEGCRRRLVDHQGKIEAYGRRGN